VSKRSLRSPLSRELKNITVKPIRITEEQLHEMGMEVTLTTVKLPAEEEGGGHLASLEVTHHLQCLVRLPVLSIL
jgi:hypothetical protein